jgi:hypothetical protein
MGAFGSGLVQGSVQGQQMAFDLEQRKQQAELFKLKSKQLKLETDMTERQLAAQAALPQALFKGPDMQQVESQGPGAPVRLPQELSDNPQGTRTDPRWDLEVTERGPGAFEEGPRPAPGMQPIPGTEGVWANLSPQYKDIAGKVLASQGYDVNKTMDVLGRLTPGIFPKQPMMQKLGKDESLVQIDPNTNKSTLIAQGLGGDDGAVAVGPGHQLKNKKTGANIGEPVPALDKPGNPKDDIIEMGGIGYQVSMGEGGKKVLTPLAGQQEKEAKSPANPVDQYIFAQSGGKYHNMAEAAAGGETALIQQAEKVVREQRPMDRAIAVGQAMTPELAKREQQAQDIKQAQPLAQKERTGLLDRKSLLAGKYVRPAPGTSIGEANRGDYIEVSDKQMEQLRTLDKASADMDSMFDLVAPLIKANGWWDSVKQAGKLHGGAATGLIPDAATYQKNKAAASTTLAKGFGGETGVMTDTDITRWTNTMIEFGDTVAVMKSKRKLSMEIRDHAVQAQRRALAGDDLDSVRTDLQQKIQPLFQKAERLLATQQAPPVPEKFKHLPKEDQDRWQQAYMERMQEMGAGQ